MANDLIIFYPKMFIDNLTNYFEQLQQTPQNLISLILDLIIVTFLLLAFIKVMKGSRAMQLLKGIAILIVATFLSGVFNFKILNMILSTIMSFGIIALLVIFQPELRRALEQLGANKFTKFFGMTKDIQTKTKEDIYKVVIAMQELSQAKIGGLIVFQRDIELSDIVANGIEIDSIISPQIIVNIFNPKTPLHDGALIIAKNRIAAAACILPLYEDAKIPKKYGTRHRAGLGISKQSDSICVIVSEETGKISVAKDGKLYEDLKEEQLKKILIDNLIIENVNSQDKKKKSILKLKKQKNEKEKKDVK